MKMKNYIIFGVVAVLVVIAATSYSPAAKIAPETSGAASTKETITINEPATAGEKITMPGGLIIQDVKVGTGDEAKKGALVTVHYTGTLTDGKKFDSSLDRGEPFQFPLGQGMVIAGWEEGVSGMKVGGVRKLTIPPEMGYGAAGAGGGVIPPNATLLFDVELLGVRYN